MTTEELRAAATTLAGLEAQPGTTRHGVTIVAVHLIDGAVAVARAYLVGQERLNVLVEYYLRMGSDAERAGRSRRAAAYRSVANMLGAVLQDADGVGVDFLALYPDPE